ncbi:MAG TPA: DUF6587 family protein [Oxalicibacterium sp.]|nr:DUF6587 family protein [Oxalicibacterium sp.]
MPQWIQGLIIALAVAWSLLHLLRKYFPRQVGRVRARWAAALLTPSRPHMVRRIGAWLQQSHASDDGCGSGCGGCSGCESNPHKAPGKDEQHPLTFHRRP